MNGYIVLDRYALENGALIKESHHCVKSQSGFSIDGQQGLWKVISYGNPLYDTSVLVGWWQIFNPWEHPLRAGVSLLSKEDYEEELTTRLDESRAQAQESQESAIPDVPRTFTDDDKIFLIDFNGSGVKTNADKRRHFNLLYGFDPVTGDPRNG